MVLNLDHSFTCEAGYSSVSQTGVLRQNRPDLFRIDRDDTMQFLEPLALDATLSSLKA